MNSQALALAIEASKSLARRRLRLSQARVRSTTHRQGRISKPTACSERLTIATVHSPKWLSASCSFWPAFASKSSDQTDRATAAPSAGHRPAFRRATPAMSQVSAPGALRLGSCEHNSFGLVVMIVSCAPVRRERGQWFGRDLTSGQQVGIARFGRPVNSTTSPARRHCESQPRRRATASAW
jgi:hypothetical protein